MLTVRLLPPVFGGRNQWLDLGPLWVGRQVMSIAQTAAVRGGYGSRLSTLGTSPTDATHGVTGRFEPAQAPQPNRL